MHFKDDKLYISGEDITSRLNSQVINKSVASYATIPELRERLVEMQRNYQINLMLSWMEEI